MTGRHIPAFPNNNIIHSISLSEISAVQKSVSILAICNQESHLNMQEGHTEEVMHTSVVQKYCVSHNEQNAQRKVQKCNIPVTLSFLEQPERWFRGRNKKSQYHPIHRHERHGKKQNKRDFGCEKWRRIYLWCSIPIANISHVVIYVVVLYFYNSVIAKGHSFIIQPCLVTTLPGNDMAHKNPHSACADQEQGHTCPDLH